MPRALPWILYLLLALSAVSSKIAGAAWLLLVLGGVLAWAQSRSTSYREEAHTAARIWLGVCLLALLVRTVPVTYWGDPWEERHAEIRLLLGALGAWGLTRKWCLSTRWVLHSLTLASVLGLALVLIVGPDHLPTNSIPWAGAIAMVGLFLLHGATLLALQRLEAAVWGMGAVSAMAAVLASGSRGAYGIVPWAVFWLLWHKRRAISRSKFAIAIVVSAVAVTGLLNTTLIQTPYSRVVTAVTEWQSSLADQSDWQNSSVGARISLWRLAEQAVPHQPWLGYGHDERLNLIHQWGTDHNSTIVTTLGHMHNQYLHDLMDHGLWGLASTLSYLTGLLGLAWWLLKRQQTFAGWTLGGLAFMHATTSLTNVNFAHNYYPTIMSIVAGLALLGIRQEHARVSDR